MAQLLAILIECNCVHFKLCNVDIRYTELNEKRSLEINKSSLSTIFFLSQRETLISCKIIMTSHLPSLSSTARFVSSSSSATAAALTDLQTKKTIVIKTITIYYYMSFAVI